MVMLFVTEGASSAQECLCRGQFSMAVRKMGECDGGGFLGKSTQVSCFESLGSAMAWDIHLPVGFLSSQTEGWPRTGKYGDLHGPCKWRCAGYGDYLCWGWTWIRTSALQEYQMIMYLKIHHPHGKAEAHKVWKPWKKNSWVNGEKYNPVMLRLKTKLIKLLKNMWGFFSGIQEAELRPGRNLNPCLLLIQCPKPPLGCWMCRVKEEYRGKKDRICGHYWWKQLFSRSVCPFYWYGRNNMPHTTIFNLLQCFYISKYQVKC